MRLAFALIVAPGCNAGVTPAWTARLALAAALRGAELAEGPWSAVLDIEAPAVRVIATSAAAAPGEIVVLLQPTIDQPDAAAYHSVDGSQPFAIVLADSGTSLDEIAIAAIHEVLETLVDPTCDQYRAGVALEVADPVQGVPDPVDIGDGGPPVSAEAHVLPAWFGLGQQLGTGTGPTTSTGLKLAPGALAPGGYVIHEDGSEGFGSDEVRIASPMRRRAPHSRRARRIGAIHARQR